MKDGVKEPMMALVTHWDPKSSAAEAFRVLRTNLQFLGLDKPLRSFIVTSAQPGEGKSFVAANIAIAFAQAGAHICLVDADLRRPTVATLFGRDNWAGLTTALIKNRPVREFVSETDIMGLSILPSGPVPPNPVELLGSLKMHALIDQLEQEHELVIYDTPPVLAVADPVVLGARTDGALLVVGAGIAGREQARKAKSTLNSLRIRLLGAVLDGLKVKRSREYGYYEYYSSEKRASAR